MATADHRNERATPLANVRKRERMMKNTFEFKRWARWLGTFVGFPLAGVTARAVAGNIDTARAAAIGGLAGGAVLGAVQVAISGIDADQRIRWIGATAAGLAAGLTVGAGAVGYRTDTASLVAMGALCGAGVGLAQALSIPMRVVHRVLWAVATPALWAGGWLITSQVITDADRQHAVFGSSGALAVSAVAGVLYALRRRGTTSTVALVGSTSDRVAA
jgi:hypothetical protein